MQITRFSLINGKLQNQPLAVEIPRIDLTQPAESWYVVSEINPDALRSFLAPLALHPLVLDRCLTPPGDPSIVSIDRTVLLEFPTILDQHDLSPVYVPILLQAPVLVTILHSPIPAMDELIQNMLAEKAPALHHLSQLLFLVIDQLSDLNVDAGRDLRDEIAALSQSMTEKPGQVSARDLARLRAQVDRLISLIENQLYCIAGLNASDNEALQEPHRKAYIQDLVAEAEISQRSVYRLENRMNDLYALYQMAGSDRVEKRLRILTIISVTTLPLGLITGILGMNVGGLPGTESTYGFFVVLILMAVIAAVELWYFIRKGWFN